MKEKEKRRRNEKALSHDDDVALFTTYRVNPHTAQPCWIPLAAVDQNYKAERTSERPLEIPLSMPRVFFFFFLLQFFLFSSLRRKREQKRLERRHEDRSLRLSCLFQSLSKREREPSSDSCLSSTALAAPRTAIHWVDRSGDMYRVSRSSSSSMVACQRMNVCQQQVTCSSGSSSSSGVVGETSVFQANEFVCRKVSDRRNV